jgi:hypothetical protein
MSNKSVCISLIATLTAFALPGLARAQAQPGANVNLRGAYRCVPEPSPCPWPGQTMSIAQSGSTLELKHEGGSFAGAKVTSDITVSGDPPWNAIGILLPDHSIQWSNGTHWRKQ